MLAPDLPSLRHSAGSLDGPWSFWPDLAGLLPTGPGAPFVAARERTRALGEPRTAVVPGPWQARFDDLRSWAGTAWYERSFHFPEVSGGRRLRVCFGAVDYHCSVWLDGRPVGEHEGGYLPFALDVTDVVGGGGDHVLTVRVLDVGQGEEDGPFPFVEIPHGKQSWYGPIGGPWQSIWLEERGPSWIGGSRIVANPATGEVSVEVAVHGNDAVEELRWRVIDPDGTAAADSTWDAANVPASVRIADPRTWDVGRPNLYRLELELIAGGEVIDRWWDRFGFRAVGVEDGRVTVNGRRVYVLGALDQDYWMPGITTPDSEEAFHEQLGRVQQLGLNLLRCHIKPPDPRYLDAADRAGVLVWCEPPSWGRRTDAAAARVRSTLEGMVARDGNHPSLIAWSIVNEDWGTDLSNRSEDRAWVASTQRWLHELDPTRLVIDNSACPPNFHVRSDLNDFHLYRATPEQLRSWRRWTSAWVADPATTYSPHGDAERTGSEPMVLSEFGTWGLPDPARLADEDGREPWWFDSGDDNPSGIVHPAGVRERFDRWGLAEVFGSWEGFVRESQEHELDGLTAQIHDLRLHPEIGGYVITELTDVHWEANGLLDMRRGRKAFHDRFRQVNAPVVVIGVPRHTRYRSGERAVIDVHVAGPTGLEAGTVTWDVQGLGISGVVHAPGAIAFDVPALEAPVRVEAELRLLSGGYGGAEVNRATIPLWLFPGRPAARPDGVLVARSWDDVAGEVRNGGRAVVVLGNEGDLPAGVAIRAERWCEDDDRTGWFRAAGLGWVHPRLTAGLPLGPRVDMAFLGITPELRLRGLGLEDRADVLAGHFLGWIHEVTASVVAVAHGRGAAIVCAFPLLQHDGRDPVATALLARLMELIADPALTPAKRMEE